MYKRIMHIGIAVKSVKESAQLFEKLLGKPVAHAEIVSDQQVATAFFRIGESALELIEPSSRASSIARFIDRKGEGVHHVSLEVSNIEEEISRLTREGFTMVDEKPRIGADGCRVAFVHPRSTNGVLVELCEKVQSNE